jgi:hypothetical protein
MKIKNITKTALLLFIGIITFVGCTEEYDYGSIKNAVKTVGFGMLTQTTVDVSGNVLKDNSTALLARGICYGIDDNPTIEELKIPFAIASLGTYTCTLTNLAPSTTYFARAYATNSDGTAYGESVTFTTLAATVPIISTTKDANLITVTTAKTGGIITHNGASAITSRGVCYSNKATIPTIADTKTNDGTAIGTFVSSLTGLSANTIYYIRAYATNSIGTAYGDVKSFTTTTATIPTGLTTTAATFITQTTAISGGSSTADGGASITNRGICWSSSTTSPTIANSKTIDGTGIGSFASSLTSLTPGTTYYVRAYATNSAGTAYAVYQIFKTLVATVPSGITTSSISSITQTTASSGGSVSDDGGATITSRGICWSSSTSSPTIYDNATNNGSGTGSFASSLTGLSANTTYYVRAYATNSAGTAYGSATYFTTLAPALAVGQSYQGGIIAYIFQSGDSDYIAGQTHGLIVTTSNQSTGSQWGCSGLYISTSTSLGTGQSNTTSIINSCNTTGIAAKICNDLVSGGYSDWYLPSFYELQNLYSNKIAIGVLSNVSYWSSSQYNSTLAYRINFSTGSAYATLKTSTIYVRAIRKF